MEKNIVRKIKRYSNNIEKKGGGDVLTLNKTQEGLLKTLVTLQNTKIPEQDKFKQNLLNISKELNRLDILLKIDSTEKVPNKENDPIFDKLSNFDKFLNGVPTDELNFNHLKIEAPVNPPLSLNINTILKLDNIINSLGKIIKFEPREETVNIIPISNLPNNEEGIKFEPRKETVGISSIEKIQIKADNDSIQFEPRKEKVGISSIEKFQIKTNSDDTIEFEPRKEKVGISSIEKFQIKVDSSDSFEFKPRKEQIKLEQLLKKTIDGMPYSLDDKKKEMDSVKLFISDNKEKLEEIILKVDKELNQYIDITQQLKIKIDFYKKEFNKAKISEAVNDIIADNYNNFEIIEVDGLEESIESIIPKIYEKDTKLTLNKKYYYLESVDFNDDNFITNLIDKSQKLPFELTGGSYKILQIRLKMSGGAYIEDFIDISKKYENIIKKRKNVIKDFSETINEYNVLFIQYFNFKFFLLKNIEKYFQTKRKIYHYLSYESIQKYLRILKHLDKIISDPDKIFNTLIGSINNIHSKMYFKHFLIIKILYNLFDDINKKWDKEKWDKTFMIDLFSYKILEFENIPKVNLCMYLLIFNFYYEILDKYNETFKF